MWNAGMFGEGNIETETFGVFDVIVRVSDAVTRKKTGKWLILSIIIASFNKGAVVFF